MRLDEFLQLIDGNPIDRRCQPKRFFQDGKVARFEAMRFREGSNVVLMKPNAAQMIRIERGGSGRLAGRIGVMINAAFYERLSDIDVVVDPTAERQLVIVHSRDLALQAIGGVGSEILRLRSVGGFCEEVEFDRDLPMRESTGFVAKNEIEFPHCPVPVPNLLAVGEDFHASNVFQPEMDQVLEIMAHSALWSLAQKGGQLFAIDRRRIKRRNERRIVGPQQRRA